MMAASAFDYVEEGYPRINGYAMLRHISNRNFGQLYFVCKTSATKEIISKLVEKDRILVGKPFPKHDAKTL